MALHVYNLRTTPTPLKSGNAPLDYLLVTGATAAVLPAYTTSGAGIGKIIAKNPAIPAPPPLHGGKFTIDGTSQSPSQRYLLLPEHTALPSDAGVYTGNAIGGPNTDYLRRATDFDQLSEITLGKRIYVQSGTTNIGKVYKVTGVPAVVDTDAIEFTEITSFEIVLPASAVDGTRGPAVNVTSEIRGMTANQYAVLEIQRAAGDIIFYWSEGISEFSTGTLQISGVPISSADVTTAIDTAITAARPLGKVLTFQFAQETGAEFVCNSLTEEGKAEWGVDFSSLSAPGQNILTKAMLIYDQSGSPDTPGFIQLRMQPSVLGALDGTILWSIIGETEGGGSKIAVLAGSDSPPGNVLQGDPLVPNNAPVVFPLASVFGTFSLSMQAGSLSGAPVTLTVRGITLTFERDV